MAMNTNELNRAGIRLLLHLGVMVLFAALLSCFHLLNSGVLRFGLMEYMKIEERS